MLDRLTLLRKALMERRALARAAAWCGLVVGLAALILAREAASDLQKVFAGNEGDTLFGSRFVSVQKEAENAADIGELEEADLTQLRGLPGVVSAAPFHGSRFNGYLSLALPGVRAMGSAVFLESLPENASAEAPDEWGWQPGQPVPLIVPRVFLDLYNFGFAPSRGLPVVSEQMAGHLPLELKVQGLGEQETLDARVAGTSARIDSLLVPTEFLDWANQNYAAPQNQAKPRRVFVELQGGKEADFAQALEATPLRTSRDLGGGQARRMTQALSSGALVSAITLTAVALIGYLLAQRLSLLQLQPRFEALFFMGWQPRLVATYLSLRVLISTLAALVLAVLLAWIMKQQLLAALPPLPFEAHSFPALGSIVAGVLGAVAVALCCAFLLFRTLNATAKPE